MTEELLKEADGCPKCKSEKLFETYYEDNFTLSCEKCGYVFDNEDLPMCYWGKERLINTVIALADEVRGKEWQPMESIPEGVHVNIYIGDGNTINTHEFLCCSLSDMTAYLKKATHWQPLPQPPKETSNEEALRQLGWRNPKEEPQND